MNMLQLYPAHTSTLLQLSYIAEQQGDHGASLAFLSRAMFTFERAFHALFTPASSASASLRVSYFRQENRGFMIATWRSIAAWMRKGCWRAAFEWSKMLASLSREDYGDAEGQHRLDGSPVPAVAVHSDPLGVWLVLDFLAVRCGEHGWVKRIWSQRHGNSSDAVRVPLLLGAKPVEWYPGWWYSTALALFLDREQSNMGDSRNALVEAMLRFPWIARVLVGRCGMQLNATELGSDDGLGHEHFNDVRFEQDDE